LIVNMQAAEWLSLEQIRAFLEASSEVGFRGRNRAEIYGWVNETLREQRYEGQAADEITDRADEIAAEA
jgi:hypothetical protein